MLPSLIFTPAKFWVEKEIYFKGVIDGQRKEKEGDGAICTRLSPLSRPMSILNPPNKFNETPALQATSVYQLTFSDPSSTSGFGLLSS